MFYSIKICRLISIISIFLFAKCAITIDNQQKENDTQFDKAHNISLEKITYLVKEGLAIIDLIEKIDVNVQKKLGVLCSGCKKKILSPAELAGWLCGGEQDQNNLEKLKIVLKQKNVQDINNFILSIAQEKKVECAFCEKYIEWVCLQYNELQNQKT